MAGRALRVVRDDTGAVVRAGGEVHGVMACAAGFHGRNRLEIAGVGQIGVGLIVTGRAVAGVLWEHDGVEIRQRIAVAHDPIADARGWAW